MNPTVSASAASVQPVAPRLSPPAFEQFSHASGRPGWLGRAARGVGAVTGTLAGIGAAAGAAALVGTLAPVAAGGAGLGMTVMFGAQLLGVAGGVLGWRLASRAFPAHNARG